MPDSISDFLTDLATDPGKQAQWRDRAQRAALMSAFGLSQQKQGILTGALRSGNLRQVDQEIDTETGTVGTAYIWIRVY